MCDPFAKEFRHFCTDLEILELIPVLCFICFYIFFHGNLEGRMPISLMKMMKLYLFYFKIMFQGLFCDLIIWSLQVVFTGGRTQPGTTKPDEGDRHPYSIIDCEPKREVILPSVIYIQKILRRRPFLIKNLENVMQRFLQSLELFEEDERKKLAIFTALAFSQRLSGLPPETVFHPLLKDNLVAKGLVLSFITDFFKEYLIDNSLDDLISILKRGKLENLIECFPSAKRTPEAFSEHFT